MLLLAAVCLCTFDPAFWGLRQDPGWCRQHAIQQDKAGTIYGPAGVGALAMDEVQLLQCCCCSQPDGYG